MKLAMVLSLGGEGGVRSNRGPRWSLTGEGERGGGRLPMAVAVTAAELPELSGMMHFRRCV